MAEPGCSLPQFINNNSLFWDTDNFVVNKIVESGSGKPELQTKAVKTLGNCKVKNLNLKISWLYQEINRAGWVDSQNLYFQVSYKKVGYHDC